MVHKEKPLVPVKTRAVWVFVASLKPCGRGNMPRPAFGHYA